MIPCKCIYDNLCPFLQNMSFISNNAIRCRNYSRFKANSYRASKMFKPVNIVPHDNERDHTKSNKEHDTGDSSELSKSNRLLTDNGLVKCAYPGNYVYLPLGMRVLQKLSNLIDQYMISIDGQKILLPTLTEGKLWKKTGRYDKTNDELLTAHDRHNRLLIFR